MVTNLEKIQLPRHGYIKKLSKLCKCNRLTVSRALFENSKGVKADLVRKMYLELYGPKES